MTVFYTCTDKLDILTLRVNYPRLKVKLKVRLWKPVGHSALKRKAIYNKEQSKSETILQDLSSFTDSSLILTKVIICFVCHPPLILKALYSCKTAKLKGGISRDNSVQLSKKALICLCLARSKNLE